MKHPETSTFSAFLEGDLKPSEMADLEAHLLACESCSGLIRDLRDIRRRARELPDRLPSRDLWPGILKAINRQGLPDPDVIRLHPMAPSTAELGGPRRFHVSVPQAVAAGLALALFSGLVGARVGSGGPSGGWGSFEDSPLQSASSWVSLVAEARPALEGRALEVARMEEALAEHRSEMDPVTVGILEKNLAAVDRAIRESVAALEADPENRFLAANLERALQARGDYLQDASLLVLSSS